MGYRKIAGLVLLAVMLSGCSSRTSYLRLSSYDAGPSAERPGRGIELYVTPAEDARFSQAEFVGRKTNGYLALGKEQDLSELVTKTIVECLAASGYDARFVRSARKIPADGPARVLNVSIEDFWTTAVPGGSTTDANAKMKLSYQVVEKGTGRILWKKKIGKRATFSSYFGATRFLFKDSLDDVFANTMKEFEDVIRSDEFVKAVTPMPAEVKAAHP